MATDIAASGLEARVARIESDVAHLKIDVADIKGELRTVRDRMATNTETADLRVDLRDLRNKVDRHFMWLLGTQAAMLTALLSAMAKGFHWL